MSQIKPLGTGAPIWECDGSAYPAIIKMPMEDGTVSTYRRWEFDEAECPESLEFPTKDGAIVTYHMEIHQPHPQCVKAVELIRMMKDNTFGGYKAKHIKKGR